MAEFEVEMDGRVVDIRCPLCEGEGKIDIKYGTIEETVKCKLCNGVGKIEDIPAYGLIYFNIEPPHRY